MLLKNGVVIGKWCVSALPDEYQLTDSLDRLEVGQLTVVPFWQKVLRLLAWYIGPLLLFTLADQLWLRLRKKKKAETTESVETETNRETLNRNGLK